MTHRLLLVSDRRFEEHETGPAHLERPERVRVIDEALAAAGLFDEALRLAPRLASEEDLALVHSPAYIELVKTEVAAGRKTLSTGDTAMGASSFDIARLSAGAALGALDAVMCGDARRAFCAGRPPGHHAEPNRGMGFCIFSNIAIVARYAQRHYGLDRVAIIDWDVHHGNGTQAVFYDDATVFFFSTHQAGLYPHTGADDERGNGKGQGTTLNRALPPGAGRREIFGAFEDDFVPAMERFRPQLYLISAGFDSRVGDPLGSFTLEDDDFAELTRRVVALAEAHARGRVISLLEGGYDLDGLARAVVAHVVALSH